MLGWNAVRWGCLTQQGKVAIAVATGWQRFRSGRFSSSNSFPVPFVGNSVTKGTDSADWQKRGRRKASLPSSPQIRIGLPGETPGLDPYALVPIFMKRVREAKRCGEATTVL